MNDTDIPKKLTPKQRERRQAIADAAYALLEEEGYKATSMLAIARRAKSSNETLYRWYGSKQALFLSLVEENARAAKELLLNHLQQQQDARTTLLSLGPILLKLVTGERAVSLNRAAVGDVYDTQTLGQSIAQAGRGSIAPLIRDIILRARDTGEMNFTDENEVTEVYINLLVGDLQIQRVIGVRPVLEDTEAEQRSQRACQFILRLYGPD